MKYIIVAVLIIGLFLYLSSTSYQYKRRIKEEGFQEVTSFAKNDVPESYLKYLEVTNTLNKKVNTLHIIMTGEMRLSIEDENYNSVNAVQTTVFETGSRLFLIEMKYKGLKVRGIHDYNKEYSQMKIKLLDIVNVVNQKDEFMHKAETVTYLNDICIFAPSALLYEKVNFNEIDSKTLEVTLTKHGYTVNAVLYFDDHGKLINFISDDRYYYEDNEYVSARWSTPLTEYTMQGDYYLPSKGSAVWTFENGDFEYLRLNIQEVMYK